MEILGRRTRLSPVSITGRHLRSSTHFVVEQTPNAGSALSSREHPMQLADKTSTNL